MACDGPYEDSGFNNPTAEYGNPGPVTASICDDAFNFNPVTFLRMITTKVKANAFNAKYEGFYKITVTGTNDRYTDLTKTAVLTWKLVNVCDVSVITGPLVVWSNPQIASMDGTGTLQSPVDRSRIYLVDNGDMEVFWQVGTTESYSQTQTTSFSTVNSIGCTLTYKLQVKKGN